MIEYLTLKSTKEVDFIDVTGPVQKIVEKSGLAEGICYLFMPHTSCSLAITEGPGEPSVGNDASTLLERLVPPAKYFPYTHEGRADAHIKSILLGSCAFIPFHEGRLILSRSQAIFLCDFAGPYERKLAVKLVQG